MPSNTLSGRRLFEIGLEGLIDLCYRGSDEDVRLEACSRVIDLADQSPDQPAETPIYDD